MPKALDGPIQTGVDNGRSSTAGCRSGAKLYVSEVQPVNVVERALQITIAWTFRVS